MGVTDNDNNIAENKEALKNAESADVNLSDEELDNASGGRLALKGGLISKNGKTGNGDWLVDWH